MMNTAKKKAALLTAVLWVCMLLLSGCHGSPSMQEFKVPEEFDESRSYEITFWAKNDTNKAQTNIYAKAIEDFEKLYPNVTVNLRLYTNYGDIYNDVITNLATKTTPNVCITYPDHIATYLTGDNHVVALDELMADEKYGLGGTALRYDAPSMDEMIPKFMNEGKIDGRSYAIPYMRSTEACYVNKTMVEKLGYTLPDVLTWDFVWEVSDKAAEKDENGVYYANGQKVMIPFIYKSTDNMMIQMLNQKKAPYSSENGDILLFNDTTRELLFNISDHVKKGSFSTFKISSYPGNFLNAGQCIFAVDSTAGATWMGTYAPLSDISEDKFVEFETQVMEIPQFDPENPSMISQGPSVCVFNKEDPQTVLASWLFAQFLLTNDVQIPYAQTEGYVPVTKKAQEAPVYQDYLSRCGEDNKMYYDVKIKASQLLLENIDHTFVTPVFNGSASLRDAAGQLIENTTKSTRRKETVDDKYMDGLFNKVTSLYRLDQYGTDRNAASGKGNLGALPKLAVVFLCMLAGVWIIILLYSLKNVVKKKRLSDKH